MKSIAIKNPAVAARLMATGLLTLSALWAAKAIAAPPQGSAYYTDPQNSYVEDATSKGIGQVNMITCFMSSMKPRDLVNQGPYVALVDEKKCNNDRRSDTSNQNATTNGNDAPQYTRAVVNSTRATNADPMVVRVWVESEIGPNNDDAIISVRVSATDAPSSSNPYGVFRLDFCGKGSALAPSAACQMNGYLDASASGLQFFETEGGGQNSQTVQLALTQGSGGDTGQGRLAIQESNGTQTQTSAFSFAYDASHYLRSDTETNSNLCFSRTEAQANKSVWRYGLYNGDGTHLDLLSGFPVTWTDTSTNVTYQGHMGYYGLWMQDNKANVIPNGATLTRQTFSQGATGQNYLLAKAGGRLTKFTKQTTTLDKLVNVKIQASFNANGQFQAFEMFWNGTQFVKSGTQSCGQNGCTITALNPTQPIANNSWSTLQGGIFGFSQTLGGEVRIADLSNLADPTQVTVAYRLQSLVYPADMPTTLYCLGECADMASMTAFFTNQAVTPWIANTGNAQFSPSGVPMAQLVAYDVNRTTGLISRQGANSPMVVTDATWLSSKPQYTWGFRNGKMFADPTAVACTGNTNNACGNKVNDLSDYYVWETGTNSFNQFTALTTTDNSNCGSSPDKYCRFDPPLQVTFTVPSGTEYGQYAGQQVVLQYGGFGELWGIPGVCVDRFSNGAVDCSQGGQNTRFVPAFVIPFDTTLGVVTLGNTTYYVKWLEREVRFSPVALSNCSTLTLPGNGLTLPTQGGFQNPGVDSSTTYIGVMPTVTDAPRVVGGVVKY